MHQTVCEFFLRPHKSVINSHFQNISAQSAREMITTTCIRYLDLHYRELGNKFQSAVGAGVSSWSSDDIFRLVRYLNSRPLIKYSLEFLTALKEDINVDPDIPKPFLELTTNLRLQNSPSTLQICLLGRLTNFSSQRVQELNHLLGIAAENGYIVAVGNLLAAGAECNTALHAAVRGGHVNVVRLLLDRGADVEAKGSSKWAPLHMAARGGHEAVIGLLLDREAAIEAKARKNQTPLHAAAEQRLEAVVELLLDRGEDVEADSTEQTPLHMAAQGGHEAVIGLLLDRGADIEAYDFWCWKPIHLAAEQGHEAAVGLLLDRGADPEAKYSGGHSVTASLGRHTTTVELTFDR